MKKQNGDNGINKMIIDDDFLDNELKNEIENSIERLPFFYMKDSVKNDDNAYMCHPALYRKEERYEGEGWLSEKTELFKTIFDKFCKKNKIKYDEILRCTVNLTYASNSEKSPIHRDHKYPHSQLLVYLNSPKDENCELLIYEDDEKTITNTIKPKKFLGVCFEDKPHAIKYPKYGDRIALVYTFN